MRECRHVLAVTMKPFIAFPIDMLRYDRCTPLTETDASLIEATIRRCDSEVTVKVMCFSRSRVHPWRIARWLSFGVSVVPSVDPLDVSLRIEPRCEHTLKNRGRKCRQPKMLALSQTVKARR